MDDCPECGGPRIDFTLGGQAMCEKRHIWVSDEDEDEDDGESTAVIQKR
jgi:hypothetical protein